MTGPAPAISGSSPVLAQRGPVDRIDEIEAVTAEPRGLAAHVVERELGVVAEVHLPETLLDAALARDFRGRRRAAAGAVCWLDTGTEAKTLAATAAAPRNSLLFIDFPPSVRHILCRGGTKRKAGGEPLS